MIIFTLFLVLTITASAQSTSGKFLEQGLRGALAAFEPITKQDQEQILRTTTEHLSEHVAFRPDNTASAIYTNSGRRQVEWKAFAARLGGCWGKPSSHLNPSALVGSVAGSGRAHR